jgi:hypothetical protein
MCKATQCTYNPVQNNSTDETSEEVKNIPLSTNYCHTVYKLSTIHHTVIKIVLWVSGQWSYYICRHEQISYIRVCVSAFTKDSFESLWIKYTTSC